MAGLSPEQLPQPVERVRWSVMVRDAATGQVLGAVEPDQVLRTASVGKVFLLVETARALAAGEVRADEPLAWADDEYVEDSGLWYRMASRSLLLGDLCLLVAAVSDNLATNVLVRRLGVEAVAQTAAGYGVQASGLLDRVRTERGPGMPWTLSVGCASELSDIMARLHRGEVVSAEVSRQVRTWLSANVDLAGVPDGFALDPLAHDVADGPVSLFSKTGAISVVEADTGVLSGPAGAVAYAALAEWEPEVSPRAAVRAEMRRLGEALVALVGR